MVRLTQLESQAPGGSPFIAETCKTSTESTLGGCRENAQGWMVIDFTAKQ